jgi:uncharacterized protein (DUF2147 family)
MDRFAMPCRTAGAVLLIMTLLYLPLPRTAASAGGPEGVWLIDSKVAVQIFDCRGQLCGRVVWLRKPRDPAGGPVRDLKNPDPALRQRLVCGLTIFWAVQRSGPNEWKSGWFYNPDDGKTYSITAKFQSPDTIVARIFLGVPLVGTTKTLMRVPRLTSEGWC